MSETHYKHVTVFENKYRLAKLRGFRTKVTDYFDNVEHNWRVDDPIENDHASALRPALNEDLLHVGDIVRAADVQTTMQQLPAPAIGGYRLSFDLFRDLLRLRSFELTEQATLDAMDRAIGRYQNDQIYAWVRTFNPLWWLWRLLNIVVSLPFALAELSGFERERFEQSVSGKLVRLISWLVTTAALILGAAVSVVTLIDRYTM
ncbi:hypothetical protein [Hyphobacterium sp.]|uniref:hypothetical protein n=1 Tax=Hyphobacterium sp. TaxID=2004662 RepID=UPI003BAA242D